MFREYLTKPMLTMLMMSFASGLPLALTGSTLQAWYSVSGVSVVTVGLLSLVGLPYAFKFLWAPVMDRYVPPFLGRRRGWILITQILLLIAILFMAMFNPKIQPLTLAMVAFLVAFLSASQDIGLDAYRTDLLTPAERGVGAAVWSNGYRIAMIVSGAVALLIAATWGWHVAYIIMAACLLIGIVTTLCSPEPVSVESTSQSLFITAKAALQDLLTRKYFLFIIGFILVYKLGDAFALSLSSFFYLRDLGFSLVQVAWVGKTFATVASITGVLVGGALMVRISLYSALMVFGWLQSIAILMFFWLAIAGKVLWLFAAAVFVENFTSGMGTIALFVFFMALCDRRFTATQYALLSVLASLGRIYIGPVAGYAVTSIGWPEFFMIAFFLGLLGLVILRWLKHRVDFSSPQIR